MSIFGKKSEEVEQNQGAEVAVEEKTQTLAEGMKNPEMNDKVKQVIEHLMHPKEQTETQEKSNEIDPKKTADPTEIPSEQKEESEQKQP